MTDNKIGRFQEIQGKWCDISKISALYLKTTEYKGRCANQCTCRELFFGGCSGGPYKTTKLVINCGGELIEEPVYGNANEKLHEAIKKYS